MKREGKCTAGYVRGVVQRHKTKRRPMRRDRSARGGFRSRAIVDAVRGRQTRQDMGIPGEKYNDLSAEWRANGLLSDEETSDEATKGKAPPTLALSPEYRGEGTEFASERNQNEPPARFLSNDKGGFADPRHYEYLRIREGGESGMYVLHHSSTSGVMRSKPIEKTKKVPKKAQRKKKNPKTAQKQNGGGGGGRKKQGEGSSGGEEKGKKKGKQQAQKRTPTQKKEDRTGGGRGPNKQKKKRTGEGGTEKI